VKQLYVLVNEDADKSSGSHPSCCSTDEISYKQ